MNKWALAKLNGIVLANLCLDISFIRCVNILRALDSGGIIKHVGAALIQSKCGFIFNCISITFVVFSIDRWNGISQPWLIERNITIADFSNVTFWHFASKGESKKRKKIMYYRFARRPPFGLL